MIFVWGRGWDPSNRLRAAAMTGSGPRKRGALSSFQNLQKKLKEEVKEKKKKEKEIKRLEKELEKEKKGREEEEKKKSERLEGELREAWCPTLFLTLF